MSDQTLELILRLTLDSQSRQNFRKGIGDLKEDLAKMRAEAEKTRQALNEALAQGDDKGAKQLQRSLEDIEALIGDTEERAKDFGKNLVDAARRSSNEMREFSERLQTIGRALALVGGGALAGLGKAAYDYAQRMGPLEEGSQRWLATSKRLEQANLQLGRASARALQPWYDRLAAITEKAAEYAEKHPGTMGGLATAAVAAVGAGGAFEVAGQGLKLVADLKLLSAATMQKYAADTMLKAAGIQVSAAKGGAAGKLLGGLPLVGSAAMVGGLAIAAAGTYVGGNALYQYLRKNTAAYKNAPESMTEAAGNTLKQAASAAAYSAGYLTGGGQERAAEWFKATAKALGVLGETAQDATRKLDGNSDAYKLYTQSLAAEKEARRTQARQRVQIEQEGEQERSRIVAQHAAQRAQVEEQYAMQVRQATQQHQTQMQRMAQDHYRALRDLQDQYQRDSQQAEQQNQAQQASLAANLNEQLASLTENYHSSLETLQREHLRRLQQMEEDHDVRVEDLVAARDALGLSAENRNYARQKKAEQQAFNDQKADLRRQLKEQTAAAREEYRKQQQELQRNFEQQEAQRKAEYERQQQEVEAQYRLERARANADFKDQMAQMAEQHAMEMRQADQQLADELRQSQENQRRKLQDLQRGYLEESRQRKEALDRQTKELLGIQETGQTTSLNSARQYWADLVAQQNQTTGQPVNNTGRAVGGYASYGRYTLGEVGEEFVLTNATTRAMEAAVGGRLTQERLVGQLTAARRRAAGVAQARQVTIHASYEFKGTLGAAEKDWVRQAAHESALQGMAEALQ